MADTELPITVADTEIAITKVDTELPIKVTDTELAITEIDTELAITKDNTELAITGADTELAITEVDTKLDITEDNTELAITEDDTANLKYQVHNGTLNGENFSYPETIKCEESGINGLAIETAEKVIESAISATIETCSNEVSHINDGNTENNTDEPTFLTEVNDVVEDKGTKVSEDNKDDCIEKLKMSIEESEREFPNVDNIMNLEGHSSNEDTMECILESKSGLVVEDRKHEEQLPNLLEKCQENIDVIEDNSSLLASDDKIVKDPCIPEIEDTEALEVSNNEEELPDQFEKGKEESHPIDEIEKIPFLEDDSASLADDDKPSENPHIPEIIESDSGVFLDEESQEVNKIENNDALENDTSSILVSNNEEIEKQNKKEIEQMGHNEDKNEAEKVPVFTLFMIAYVIFMGLILFYH